MLIFVKSSTHLVYDGDIIADNVIILNITRQQSRLSNYCNLIAELCKPCHWW